MPSPACIPRAVFGVPVDQVAAADDTAEEATVRALRDRLRFCVSRLPEHMQRVTVLRYGLFGVEPRSLREIAAELDVSLGTAHNWERAALDLLRDWL